MTEENNTEVTEKITVETNEDVIETKEKKEDRLNWKSYYCAEKKVPKYVINLDDPPEKRWNHVIADYKDKFPLLVDYVEKEFKAVVGSTLTSIGKSLVDTIFTILANSGAAYLEGELRSISKSSGIGIGLLLIVQLSYEICAFCTSIVAQDKNGVPYHVRSMDWAIDILKEFTIEVDFQMKNRTLYSATTWAGYIGILTGMRPNCFSISINYRTLNKNPLNNILKTLTLHWPVSYAVRQALTVCHSYDTAVEFLKKVELISPVYITVCGVKKNQGCLITRSPSKSENFISLDNLKSEDETISYPAKDEGFILQTNCDWWLVANSVDNETIMNSRSRVESAIKAFNELTSINEEEIANTIFMKKPIVNNLTIYITAMCPKTGYISTRLTV